MIIRMMYMLPMMLGRTFDVNNNTVGVDIFPEKEVQNPRISQEPYFQSNYKTLETSSEVKDVLDINGDLSLNIKAGTFAFRGMGSYVKESLKSENSVDILTKVSFRTVSKSLSYSARPVPAWTSFGKEYLGTHFVRTIIYGGDLIASVRFTATNSEDLQDIRGIVKASLASGSALELVAEGTLENLEKKLEKKARMEINYFATVPIEGVPHTIQGFRDLVKNFEEHVRKVNGGLGVPVEVELDELATMNEGFAYLRNSMLDMELKFFEDDFDDLLSTKFRLKSWIDSLPDNLNSDQEKAISSFSARLSRVIGIFIDTIANLNLEDGADQLEKANEAYKEGNNFAFSGKFHREFIKLEKKIEVSKLGDETRGSSVYTRFGSKNCKLDNFTTTVCSGYLASSPRNISGAGHNYLCLPTAPQATGEEEYSPNEKQSLIAGVKYGLLEDKPSGFHVKDIELRGVVCAVCHVKERSTLVTFADHKQCPEEGSWTEEYKGFFMSSKDVSRAETICVDSSLQSHLSSYMRPEDPSLTFVQGSRDNQTMEFLPCVVCTK